LVLAAPEHNLEAPLEAKAVEETFVNRALLLHLRVAGQLIRTTGQHPFFVRGKGWTAAAELRKGDQLRGHDDRWHAVETVTETGDMTTVYNVRVADYHTYFVGRRDWRFSAWAHNNNPCWLNVTPNPNIQRPYARPNNAPTPAQRKSVQGQPCAECGRVAPKQYADHKEPLVVEYYQNGRIDINKQKTPQAVQPHCPTCSAKQGGNLSGFSKKMKKILGL
jgi:hypothetical protein